MSIGLLESGPSNLLRVASPMTLPNYKLRGETSNLIVIKGILFFLKKFFKRKIKLIIFLLEIKTKEVFSIKNKTI